MNLADKQKIRSGSLEGFILYYNALLGSEGIQMQPHLVPIAKALLDRTINNLMVIVGPGVGKSLLISVIYPTYMLGIDPEHTFLGISGGEDLIQGFMRSSMQIIEHHPVYREIFPDVRPDKQSGWSTERGLFVSGHRLSNPDASYWGAGIGSKTLTGKHGETLILDDIHNLENSATPEQIESVVRAFTMTIMGRADPMGARFIIAGRRWAVNDVYGQLMERGDFVTLSLPFEREGSSQLYYDVSVPEGVPCQIASPEVKKIPYGIDPKKQGFFWPTSDQKRREYFIMKRSQPRVTKAVYQCQPISTNDAIFEEESLLYYDDPPYLGMGRTFPGNAEFLKRFEHLIQSWDTAGSATTSSDYSVGLTAGLLPCQSWHRGEDSNIVGPCDSHYDVFLLDETRVRLEPKQLLGSIREAFKKWKPDLPIRIEKKSSGESLISILSDVEIPIIPVTVPPLSKVHRATVSLGTGTFSVQGWFALGRIFLPRNASWVTEFVAELLRFDGSRNNQDDRVDSLVQLVSAVIQFGPTYNPMQENADRPVEVGFRFSHQQATSDTQTMTLPPSGMSRLPIGMGTCPELDMFASQMDIFDPFEMTCGRCSYFDPKYTPALCTFHRTATSAIHSCDSFVPKDQGINPFFLDATNPSLID